MKKTQTPRKTLARGIALVLKRLYDPLDVMLLHLGSVHSSILYRSER
jgi:hypothetical protein